MLKLSDTLFAQSALSRVFSAPGSDALPAGHFANTFRTPFAADRRKVSWYLATAEARTVAVTGGEALVALDITSLDADALLLVAVRGGADGAELRAGATVVQSFPSAEAIRLEAALLGALFGRAPPEADGELFLPLFFSAPYNFYLTSSLPLTLAIRAVGPAVTVTLARASMMPAERSLPAKVARSLAVADAPAHALVNASFISQIQEPDASGRIARAQVYAVAIKLPRGCGADLTLTIELADGTRVPLFSGVSAGFLRGYGGELCGEWVLWTVSAGRPPVFPPPICPDVVRVELSLDPAPPIRVFGLRALTVQGGSAVLLG